MLDNTHVARNFRPGDAFGNRLWRGMSVSRTTDMTKDALDLEAIQLLSRYT